jgi:hypothetical protein
MLSDCFGKVRPAVDDLVSGQPGNFDLILNHLVEFLPTLFADKFAAIVQCRSEHIRRHFITPFPISLPLPFSLRWRRWRRGFGLIVRLEGDAIDAEGLGERLHCDPRRLSISLLQFRHTMKVQARAFG